MFRSKSLEFRRFLLCNWLPFLLFPLLALIFATYSDAPLWSAPLAISLSIPRHQTIPPFPHQLRLPEVFEAPSVTKITSGAAVDAYPAWAPDGRKVAFISDRDGTQEVFVMNADGSGVIQLTNDVFQPYVEGFPWQYGTPVWSPDGNKILFSGPEIHDGEVGGSDIYVMNADGSNLTNLTNSAAWESEPLWSPDGSKILFSLYEREAPCCAYSLYMMAADGDQPLPVISNIIPTSRPLLWSPDGSKLLYVTNDYKEGLYESLIVNTYGGHRFFCTEPKLRYETYAVWSPVSNRIAYVEEGDIYILSFE